MSLKNDLLGGLYPREILNAHAEPEQDEMKQLLLAYRDGHAIRRSVRECFVREGRDTRCDLCKLVDKMFGTDAHVAALDSMLHSLRMGNKGLKG